MSEYLESDANFDKLPDYFSLMGLSEADAAKVLSDGDDWARSLRQLIFNGLMVKLVDDVGLSEEEIYGWFFSSSASGLEEKTPVDVWQEPGGIERVFDYASLYGEQATFALLEDEMSGVWSQN